MGKRIVSLSANMQATGRTQFVQTVEEVRLSFLSIIFKFSELLSKCKTFLFQGD